MKIIMKIIFSILKYILVVLLTLVVIAIVIAKIASSTILNESYVLSKLDETGYYRGIYSEVYSNFENYIGPSGLDEEVFENIVSEDKIREDTYRIIDNIYQNKIKDIDTDEIRENLNNNIEKYLEGRTLTSEQETAIGQYVDKICEEYATTILHATSYEQKIAKIFSYANSILPTFIKGVMIATIVLIIILMIFNYNKVFRGVAQVGISVTSSGLFLLISNFILNSKVKIDNIIVMNETFSKVIRVVLNDICDKISNVSLILLVCGLIAILISNSIYNKKKIA